MKKVQSKFIFALGKALITVGSAAGGIGIYGLFLYEFRAIVGAAFIVLGVILVGLGIFLGGQLEKPRTDSNRKS